MFFDQLQSQLIRTAFPNKASHDTIQITNDTTHTTRYLIRNVELISSFTTVVLIARDTVGTLRIAFYTYRSRGERERARVRQATGDIR
jgi:hypothetical protein